MGNIASVTISLNRAVFNLEHKVGELIQETCQLCEAQAKLFCPVDTGKLMDSITYVRESALSASVSTNVEYAIFVEMGTYKMEPQPYLFPAFEIATSYFDQDVNNL